MRNDGVAGSVIVCESHPGVQELDLHNWRVSATDTDWVRAPSTAICNRTTGKRKGYRKVYVGYSKPKPAEASGILGKLTKKMLDVAAIISATTTQINLNHNRCPPDMIPFVAGLVLTALMFLKRPRSVAICAGAAWLATGIAFVVLDDVDSLSALGAASVLMLGIVIAVWRRNSPFHQIVPAGWAQVVSSLICLVAGLSSIVAFP